jgi:hypothetical protein
MFRVFEKNQFLKNFQKRSKKGGKSQRTEKYMMGRGPAKRNVRTRWVEPPFRATNGRCKGGELLYASLAARPERAA